MTQRHLNQTLTYWPPAAAGATNIYGKPASGSPVQYSCRWEDRSEQIQGKGGEQFVSKSRVFLNEQVEIDGYVYLGTSAASDPSLVDGAQEIQQVARQPDLRNIRSLTVLYL